MRRGTVTAFITAIFVLAMATTSTTGYSRGTARVIEPASSYRHPGSLRELHRPAHVSYPRVGSPGR